MLFLLIILQFFTHETFMSERAQKSFTSTHSKNAFNLEQINSEP